MLAASIYASSAFIRHTFVVHPCIYLTDFPAFLFPSLPGCTSISLLLSRANISPSPSSSPCVSKTSCSGDASFISSVQKGRVCGCQFHPEKSGDNGLNLISAFLKQASNDAAPVINPTPTGGSTSLAKRIIACLDVRENDKGDLVVTKGDQYDVREKSDGEGDVRNLGKPVELARRYSEEGADEITFLNITSYRGDVVDAPMLRVLELTSEHVFVPLCIGGGIRDYTDSQVSTAASKAAGLLWHTTTSMSCMVGSYFDMASSCFINVCLCVGLCLCRA